MERRRRLRLGVTELVFIFGGVSLLVEQEAVRVLSGGRLDPNILITGVSLILLLLGAGVITLRSMKIGPFHLTLREQAEEDEEDRRLAEEME